jgi:hypothetical protein
MERERGSAREMMNARRSSGTGRAMAAAARARL